MSQILQSEISSLVSTARIVRTPLPGVPEIQLWLLEENWTTPTPLELSRAMRASPYWAFCWACGLAMGRWIIDNPEIVAGKDVIDMGCGSGVVAIAAAIAGASKVTAWDIDETALIATSENAALNGVKLQLTTNAEKPKHRFDVLLASDVIYDPANYSLLDQFGNLACESWIADSRVPDFPHQSFQLVAKLEATTVPDLGESKALSQIRLYRFRA